jgi:hypothetical protein
MTRRSLLLLALTATVSTPPAHAWWPEGHSTIARAAVQAQPGEVPAFFRRGGETVAHLAQDPDAMKNRALPNVSDAESPEHYLDRELLRGRAIPATRSEYLRLCAELKVNPKDVGYVPYAVAEWTERLTIAFAEHRRWPTNRIVRTRCLFYAGILAHYAGDLCQPLHLTIHHDGRARSDNSSPKTGIHHKVDALIERLGLTPRELSREQTPQAFPALMPAIIREMDASSALVERVYELEPKLPPTTGDLTVATEVAAFTRERARAATRFLASLYLTAWRNSASVKLPEWMKRGS